MVNETAESLRSIIERGSARGLAVLGFIQDVIVRLLTEYAMTLNMVIELEFGRFSKVG